MFMKLKVTVVAVVAALCVFGFYVLKPAETLTKEQVILSYVFQATDKFHYLNKKIDDDFSAKAYQQYLKSIDRGKRMLLATDVAALDKYKTEIDNEINEQAPLAFYNEAQAIIQKREIEIEAVYKEILSKPFDFNVAESVVMNEDKRSYPANENDRKELWRKLLKYQVLSRYHGLKERQSDTVKVKKTDVELEKEAREKVLKMYEDWSKNIKQNDAMEKFSVYVNALMSVYDPHTNYFAPVEKKDFDIHMTGRLEGIGATLQEKDGYVKVTAIVAGSASWKQGELEVGDLITEVAQGADKPVDVVDMRLDKVVSMIRGPKGTEVRLTVKKVDGTTKIIPIIRDIVILEETFAKSAILQRNGDDKKYGYINLPSFYADFSGEAGGRSSANDVLKEVERLAVNEIQGTIIDLRNNGGGSLQDAIEMIGIFIESGPVVIVDDPSHIPHPYVDPDPKLKDAKPLIVLVNGYSASASEIFAAAIQDYKRGVIMGTESTFGKGTVQRFYDLDNFMPTHDQYASYKSLGSVKVTISKFFRINGGATQRKGVVPDIIMPDVYSGMEQGEKEEDFAMEWTKIKKAKYKLYPTQPNYKELQDLAKMRMDTSSYFKTLNSHLMIVRKEEKADNVSLKYEDYDREMKEIKASNQQLEKIIDGMHSVKADYLLDEKAQIESDKALKERLGNFHESLVNDEYIYQALISLSQMKK